MERLTPSPQYLNEASSEHPDCSKQLPRGSTPLQSLNISQPDSHTNTRVTNPLIPTLNHQPPPLSLVYGSSPRTVQHTGERSQSRFTQWIIEWIVDWWGIEITCWIIAVLSLIAIVITLEIYKNQPMPQWSFGITINSFISIFATIGHMAMMQPIVSCISQLKWLWFERKGKLSAFEAFDDASRGPTGSLVLLWKLHGMHLVSLGAAITIASAAFGPFAQQVVTYPLHLHKVGNASVSQAFNFTALGGVGGMTSPATINSISDALAPGNFNLSTVAPICSTSNCSWTDYSSLGICTTVSDISSAIISNPCDLTSFENLFKVAGVTNTGYPCFNYTLPVQVVGSVIHNNTGSSVNATLSNTFSAPTPKSLTMQIMSFMPATNNISSVGTFYLMYQPGFSSQINNSALPDPVAYELNLNFCIQTYNTIISNGATDTTLLSTRLLETHVENLFNTTNRIAAISANDSYVSIEENYFGVSSVGLGTLSVSIMGGFSASCFNTPLVNDTGHVECNYPIGNPILQLLENSTDLLSALTDRWHNVGISMTNAFRTGSGGDTQIGQFYGIAFASIPYVESNYLWLILPISLVAFTLIFLIATILKGQRIGSRVWKSSNYATLQGLHTDLRDKIGGLTSVSEMQEKAKEVEVRFDMGFKNGKRDCDVEYRLVESKQEGGWRG